MLLQRHGHLLPLSARGLEIALYNRMYTYRYVFVDLPNRSDQNSESHNEGIT
jgi:hypothetical protein